jgi:hypothetical protein
MEGSGQWYKVKYREPYPVEYVLKFLKCVSYKFEIEKRLSFQLKK